MFSVRNFFFSPMKMHNQIPSPSPSLGKVSVRVMTSIVVCMLSHGGN